MSEVKSDLLFIIITTEFTKLQTLSIVKIDILIALMLILNFVIIFIPLFLTIQAIFLTTMTFKFLLQKDY